MILLRGVDMKELVQKFFTENMVGKFIIRSLALLNTVEGIVHIIVSIIGGWGLIDIHATDFRAWLPVVENFVFGLLSIVTGWALETSSHNH